MGPHDSEPMEPNHACATGLATSQSPIPAGWFPRRCTNRCQPRATPGQHLPAQVYGTGVVTRATAAFLPPPPLTLAGPAGCPGPREVPVRSGES